MAQHRYEHAEGPSEGLPLGIDPSRALHAAAQIARENPHAALAGAVAVGFVLGGGMTPKLLGAMAMFAARQYLRATLEETMASLQTTLEGSPHV